MNNKELIKNCRETLSWKEEEPYHPDWINMVENLCNALEKAEEEIKNLNRTVIYIGSSQTR